MEFWGATLEVKRSNDEVPRWNDAVPRCNDGVRSCSDGGGEPQRWRCQVRFSGGPADVRKNFTLPSTRYLES